MIIGIDASNIRTGGGVTHLVEFLRAAKPQEYGFEQIIIWSSSRTLSQLDERPWLCKVHEPLLDRVLPFRVYWQRFKLDRLARAAGCGLLFVPGGTYRGSFRPFVTMSQNLLPFEWNEARRYGVSWQLLRNALLRRLQSQTFRKADGVIFLTEYARNSVMKVVKHIDGADTVIPHGINAQFDHPTREQRDIGQYSREHPFRILYVSVVDVYKHQWHVAEAVSRLWKAGLPVRLDLVGPACPPALRRLQNALDRLNSTGNPIRYHGPVPYTDLPGWYQEADLFVFASSCETFCQILTEAMASGLPIACSNRGPMPEILGNFGEYFDPEQPGQIERALRILLEDSSRRQKCAQGAYARARQYSWKRCASETLAFLVEIAR